MKLEKLSNTRDLGGIKGAYGRLLKKGRLIRSGQLFFASDSDITELEKVPVRRVIDFRTTKEKNEKPDPVPAGAHYLHLPVFNEEKHGITREESGKSAFQELMESVSSGSDGAVRYMMRTYRDFVTDEHALLQYSRFLSVILENGNGAVLWHCTAGKDRAGFATVLILEILGADRNTITEDYLQTNTFLEREIEEIMTALKPVFPNNEEMLRAFFSAREEYLDSVYETVHETYGSFDTFLESRLGVTSEIREMLRAMYLE